MSLIPFKLVRFGGGGGLGQHFSSDRRVGSVWVGKLAGLVGSNKMDTTFGCKSKYLTRAQLLLTWANEWDGRFDDLHMIYAKLQLTKCTIRCYASETPSPLQNFLLFFHYNINQARRPTGG